MRKEVEKPFAAFIFFTKNLKKVNNGTKKARNMVF